ncbi:autotransporter domain-containing protein, partial [Lysobacter cavernae]
AGFNATASYTVVITAPAITITPATLPGGTAGVAYSQTLSSSGGIAPYSYSIPSGNLPIGMSFSSAGVLSGTPTTAGSYTFSVRSTDDAGFNATASYTVVITAPAITITPATLPGGTAGVAYSQTLSSSGGIAPYSYSIPSGNLPIGMSFSSAGVLSGTPTTAGSYTVSIRSTDDAGFNTTASYTIVITAPTITITPATLPGGTVATAYSQTHSASGGTAPYSFSLVSGALPIGTAFSSAGALSGTPTTSGSYTFTVRVTDHLGFNSSQAYTVVIADGVPVASDDSATTPAQHPITIAATGNDTGVISAIAIAAPPAHGTAVVNGLNVVYTPTGAYFGPDSLTYTATGPGGTSAPATVSIAVTPLPVPVGQPHRVSTLAGQAVTIDTTVDASGGPFTGVTLVTPPATGTAVVAGTRITYTPTASAAGTALIVYTLNNAFGASAPITSTVAVNPLPVAVAQTVTTVAGLATTVELTQGASGGPFTAATLVALTPAGSGTAVIAPASGGYRLTYTPAIGFSGQAVAQFTLANAFATSAPAGITFEVAPRPDPTRDEEVRGLLEAQSESARRFAQAQIGNFQQRMEGLHGAGARDARFRNSLSFATSRPCLDNRRHGPEEDCQLVASSDDVAAASRKADSASGSTSEGASDYTIWTAGAVRSGNYDGRGGGGGLDFETDGISVGADFRVNPAFALGAGLGYGRDDSDIGSHGSRVEGDAYTAALYGSYHPGETYFLDALGGYQKLSYDLRRHLTVNGGSVAGSRDGSQWFVSLSTGADIQRGAWQYTPYARLDVARATLDGYAERGDLVYSLVHADQDVDTSTGNVGVRFEFRRDTAWGMFSPQLRVEYQRDFEADSSATMQYLDLLTGPVYRADLDGFDRSRFMLGLGAMFLMDRDFSLRVEYRGLFGNGGDRDNALLLNFQKGY